MLKPVKLLVLVKKEHQNYLNKSGSSLGSVAKGTKSSAKVFHSCMLRIIVSSIEVVKGSFFSNSLTTYYVVAHTMPNRTEDNKKMAL